MDAMDAPPCADVGRPLLDGIGGDDLRSIVDFFRELSCWQLRTGAGRPILDALRVRLVLRWHFTRSGCDVPRTAPIDRETMALLSGFQRRLFDRVRGRGREVAFLLFASGQMEQGASNDLVPDSADFLLWAEFAAMAVEEEVDCAFWSELLPRLVKAGHVFTLAYGPQECYQGYNIVKRSARRTVTWKDAEAISEHRDSAALTAEMGRVVTGAILSDPSWLTEP